MPKFHSNPDLESADVTVAGDSQLDTPLAPSPLPQAGADGASHCYVVSVGAERDPVARAAQLAEIEALVQHQGGHVVGRELHHLVRPNARTLLGTGTARAIASRARALGATLLVIDAELSPSQTRNLEEAAGIAIGDREGIILNVFLRHARSRRAKIQVELAQLEYLRPRIRGVGLSMAQQTGGNKSARGPGETESELMARKLDSRLLELKRALSATEATSLTQRQQRRHCHRIALVGYTNAGKTSLMNALTHAQLSARDMPFETLDTTSRCLTRHGEAIVLSDTVGFIRRLPSRLLDSFQSTLAEASEASLLLVVVDASDPERELQLRTTQDLIEKVGAAEVPRFYVFNKADRLPESPSTEELEALAEGSPWALLSAHDDRAVAELSAKLLAAVRSEEQQLTTFVPYTAGSALGLIYANCRVASSEATEDGLTLRFHGSPALLSRIRHSLKSAS